MKDEQQRYKNAHTVRVGDYLAYPYRKRVSGKIESDLYIEKLEKEYLPRIKASILVGSKEQKESLSYDL